MPEASASPLDRVRFLVNSSRRSQAGFSRLINLDPSTLSRILSGHMAITDQFLNRLTVNLGVSKQWLATGDGVPFPRKEAEVAVIDGVPVTDAAAATRPKGAPVYDIDATAGAMPISNMFASDRIIGYLDMPRINPECPIVHVSGDSMEPVVPDGSLISIREIRDTSIIMWGNIYLVELEDYRMVKYLRRHPSDPSMVVLHSGNPAYDDIDIPRSSVLKLFLVENVIKYSSLV